MSYMAGTDRYSRLVLWLKVALPLVALAILSTLFLVAESLDPQAAIPYAKVDVERLLEEQGMTRPSFGGLTSNGVAVSISAETVRPDPDTPSRLIGADIDALLTYPDGGQVNIAGPDGILDATTNEVRLMNGARLESTSGYIVETDNITASVEQASVEASTEIRATGPIGDLTAGSMILSQAEDGNYLLVFKNGVRLIYEPGS